MSNSDKKRLLVDTNRSSSSKKSKVLCSFEEKCFRKNPHHFMEYAHPHLDDIVDTYNPSLELPSNYLDKAIVFEQLKIIKDLKKPANELWQNFQQSSTTNSTQSSTDTGGGAIASSSTSKTTKTTAANFASKLKCNEPYCLFFTVIEDSSQTKIQNNSIQLTDLLCPSLGNLKSSLQINFIVDIMWLMEQYALTGNEKKPMTLLYGDAVPNMKTYMARQLPNVTPHLVEMSDPFGTHHSKIGIYAYTNGSIRVVVSTANLYYEDWNNYCQGVWVSPLCPALSSDKPDSAGSGPTDFKGSIISYLKHYKLSILDEWITNVKRADFSDIKVFFINTLPGKHSALTSGCHLQRVADLLSRHCTIPECDNAPPWQVIAQSSSLGSFGPTAAMWLRGALLRTLASTKKQQTPMNSKTMFSIVYPSVENVMSCYKGVDGAGCLPYMKAIHNKQRWLKEYLHEWKAERSHRTRAMPHIKTYCRVSPCHSKLAYFLLTSANISKAAWGSLNSTDRASYARSYEVGVLFLPKFFEEPYFVINPEQMLTRNLFPFIYDLPLSPYKSTDMPYTRNVRI